MVYYGGERYVQGEREREKRERVQREKRETDKGRSERDKERAREHTYTYVYVYIHMRIWHIYVVRVYMVHAYGRYTMCMKQELIAQALRHAMT